MPVVGLTGGIASGKSTVARVFRSKGAAVLDADEAAREVTAPGEPAYRRIVENFGSDVLSADGSLDRSRLAELVFADPGALRALEAITHPEIFRVLTRKVLGRPRSEIVVIEAALLFETLDEWKEDLKPDALVVVFSPPDRQYERLESVRGMSRTAAAARVKAQAPWEAKMAAADYVIDNSGSLEALEEEAARVWDQLRMRLGGGA